MAKHLLINVFLEVIKTQSSVLGSYANVVTYLRQPKIFERKNRKEPQRIVLSEKQCYKRLLSAIHIAEHSFLLKVLIEVLNMANNMHFTYKPRHPKVLKDLETDNIRNFVHEFENYIEYLSPGQVGVYEFIHPKLWEKLTEEDANTFVRTKTEERTNLILIFFKTIITAVKAEKELN